MLIHPFGFGTMHQPILEWCLFIDVVNSTWEKRDYIFLKLGLGRLLESYTSVAGMCKQHENRSWHHKSIGQVRRMVCILERRIVQ